MQEQEVNPRHRMFRKIDDLRDGFAINANTPQYTRFLNTSPVILESALDQYPGFPSFQRT